MWPQIVGKTRLTLAPQLTHWWEVPLYLTSRGLTTRPIPFGDKEFEATFDFIDHVLNVHEFAERYTGSLRRLSSRAACACGSATPSRRMEKPRMLRG